MRAAFDGKLVERSKSAIRIQPMPKSRLPRGNEPREQLEQGFAQFVERLTPKPEYVQLFSEIIVDVWKERQSQAVAVHKVLMDRVRELKNRKQLLVEAFVYQKALDKQTYQEQSDKLGEEITLAEIAEQDTRLDELDFEAPVEFAQHVLLNAARIWSESGPEQKERLQKLVFPAGVLFAEGVYRTTATSMVFFELEEIYDQNEGLVGPVGFEPTKGCS